MKCRLLLYILLILETSLPLSAQFIVSGTVSETGKQTNLPFVNIGIKGKNIGTTSLANGSFSINIPPGNRNDILTISMVGYEELNVTINQIAERNQKFFFLNIKPSPLSPVIVSTAKLEEKSFGLKHTPSEFHITDGSINQNDIFEIAQLIKLDSTIARVTELSLLIRNSEADSGIFRINFYRYNGSVPTERIFEKSIVQRKKINEGWLTFDMKPFDVYLKGTFIAAIEFIPQGKQNNTINYEVKIGGSSKSFVRKSSQGEWIVPPHHYRMFLKALVEDKSDKEVGIEENETRETASLYSQSVKDSFSVFIHLPKNYSDKTKRTYPLIYLLDANVYFEQVTDIFKQKDIQAILVGIGYKNFQLMDSLRNRDYLYPRETTPDEPSIGGGATKFLSFMEKELIPYVAKKYSVDSSNSSIMGHSFGGYFVLYALLESLKNNTLLFKNYITVSPSLEYSNNFLIKEFENLADKAGHHKILYLNVGGREDNEDGGTGTTTRDNFNRFIKIVSDKKLIHLRIQSEVFPAYGHMETAIPGFTKFLLQKK